MIRRVAVTFLALSGVSSLAQPRQFRFYLAYGDVQTVAIARLSGRDPEAALGREIPSGVAFGVPTDSAFKVQLGVEHLAHGQGIVYVKNLTSFIAYDRAHTRNITFEEALPLDTYSFRKLSPVHTGPQQIWRNASNWESRIVYNRDMNTVDENGDGIPDLGTQTHGMGFGVGAYVPGSDGNFHVRPIGTSYFLEPAYPWADGSLGYGWFKMQPGEQMHIFDLEYKNILHIGETYGFGTGETGLLLHTAGGEQTGYSNNIGYSRNSNMNPEPWQNIGAKYNLIGAALVPEPNSLLAVALGALLLRRRRAR